MARVQFPQLGGGIKERYHVTSASTGEPKYLESGGPETSLRFESPASPNFNHPDIFAAALGNFMHSITSSPKAEQRSGMEWYPKVHDAVAKAVRSGFLSGHSNPEWAGAGVVAAVSPGMDFERSNIHALTELRNVSGHHWDALLNTQTTAKAERARKQARVDIVGGTSLRQTGMGQLQKAGRIIHQGADPNEALPFATSPKTHSFAHNIHDPSDRNYATVDGRAFDTMTNMVRPWEYTGRGIGKADLKTPGRQSRYEQSRNVIQSAADALGIHPSQAQAVSWEHVKQHIELAGRTRKLGPERVGQPYFHPETGEPAMHNLAPYHHLLSNQFVSPYA